MDYVRKMITKFLPEMKIRVTYHDASTEEVSPIEEKDGWKYKSNSLNGRITAKCDGATSVYYAEFHTKKPLANRFAITFAAGFEKNDEILLSALDYGSAVWLYHYFPKKTEDFPYTVSNMLVHRGDLHYNLTMLLGEESRTEWDMNGLHICPGVDTLCDVSGPFLAITEDEDPYRAIDVCYKTSANLGAIRVPLIESRPLPKIFREFGYCTWNTFYQNVTSAGIYQKLDEFKKKHVPIQWMIIDDGWVQINEHQQLRAFEENREKFPEGLKACIKRIKEEYGVKYVGIWHTLNYWWFGIDPESELAKEYADCLTVSKMAPGNDQLQQMLIPCDDPEKSFRLWDDWHSYLAECGVDFVKVDNQSNSFYYLRDNAPAASGSRHLHEAIERSIEKHFGGIAIDCMGMESGNVLSRPYTAVTRNSDDFYPDKENGFFKHLTQNAYNALWQGQLYHCDYDMWWSGKASPVESGVLRSISGGPVYVSDAINETNPGNILPICGEDGKLDLFDHAALPTRDEIYTDGISEGKPFKVFNKYNDCCALAVFNLSGDTAKDTLCFEVIPDLHADMAYVMYEYFTKKFSRVNADDAIEISLHEGEVRAYSFFPIKQDNIGEYILFGDERKYFPSASPLKRILYLDQISF